MPEAAGTPGSYVARGEKIVVLLLPELLGDAPDEAQVRATLVGPRPARALVCLPDQDGPGLVAILDRLGIETEILHGDSVTPPATKAFTLQAPPGILASHLTEFALALSDVLLVAPGFEQNTWARTAALLDKPTVAPGAALPVPATIRHVAPALDPDQPGWWRALRRLFWGRTEQGLLELFAFNWRGRADNGVKRSLDALRKCLGRKWRPGSYFAPSQWTQLEPDQKVLQPASGMSDCFNMLDRSAVYGAYIHRDLVWLEHLGAAFAVLAAVLGHLTGHMADSGIHLVHWHDVHLLGWGTVELLALALVAAMVIGARGYTLHARWTALRLGAEQLRIAMMSMPLLVLPSALATEDKEPDQTSHASKEAEFGFVALAQVKRTVRAHGLPRLRPGLTPADAADWLLLIVRDQLDYHRKNHRKLARAEHRLRRVTQLIFLVGVVAVLGHFFIVTKWLLLGTAAAPAFAAAFHGTGTRLGIADRAELSTEIEAELDHIAKEIAKVKAMAPGGTAWAEIRRLAFEAAEAMGRENTSWHNLVRRYPHELP